MKQKNKNITMIHPCNCTHYNGEQCYNCLNGAHNLCQAKGKHKCNKKPSKHLGLMITVKTSLFCLLSCSLLACSKGGDYGYLNTDRRPQVIIISQRYTNPPVIENGNWKPYKIVYDSLSRDIDFRSYENLKPDTLISSCSIDKRDSLFKIEIRKYLINR